MKVFGTEANLFLLVMFCFSKPLLEEKVVVFLETLLGQNQNFPLESGMLYWCF